MYVALVHVQSIKTTKAAPGGAQKKRPLLFLREIYVLESLFNKVAGL